MKSHPREKIKDEIMIPVGISKVDSERGYRFYKLSIVIGECTLRGKLEHSRSDAYLQ